MNPHLKRPSNRRVVGREDDLGLTILSEGGFHSEPKLVRCPVFQPYEVLAPLLGQDEVVGSPVGRTLEEGFGADS